MAKRTKVGRRANANERELAAEIAANIFKTLYAANFSDLPIEERFETAFYLCLEAAGALERFRKDGTFQVIDNGDTDRINLRWGYRELRGNGVNFEETVAELARQHHMSESTVIRRLKEKTYYDKFREDWLWAEEELSKRDTD